MSRSSVLIFQSTLSMRRATDRFHVIEARGLFQSTLSMRRATIGVSRICLAARTFQSTLSMRRATWHSFRLMFQREISIHALHEESDTDSTTRLPSGIVISIHALHEESDLAPDCKSNQRRIFQSTLSMRRATVQLDIFVRFLRCKPAA